MHYSRPNYVSNETLEGYHFFRFWPNGRVLYRNQLIRGRVPTAQDGDEIDYGSIRGCYSVSGNQIRIELLNMVGEYEQKRGTITSEGIVLIGKHGGELSYKRVRLPPGSMKKQL
jgi:hypothetical protein